MPDMQQAAGDGGEGNVGVPPPGVMDDFAYPVLTTVQLWGRVAYVCALGLLLAWISVKWLGPIAREDEDDMRWIPVAAYRGARGLWRLPRRVRRWRRPEG